MLLFDQVLCLCFCLGLGSGLHSATKSHCCAVEMYCSHCISFHTWQAAGHIPDSCAYSLARIGSAASIIPNNCASQVLLVGQSLNKNSFRATPLEEGVEVDGG